jgi:hypothetical protein
MEEFFGNLQYILQSMNDSHIILKIKLMFQLRSEKYTPSQKAEQLTCPFGMDYSLRDTFSVKVCKFIQKRNVL